MQQRIRNRRVAVREHADGGGVDQTHSTLQRVLDAVGNDNTLMRAQQRRKLPGPRPIGIEDADTGHAQARKRKGNGLSDAARADDGDGAMLRAGNQVGGGPGEPRGVGVVANQDPVMHHDGVDRAHGGGFRRKLVEEIDDRFLVGIGHVDTGKAETPHALQQIAQRGTVRARDLDELIMAMHSERSGCLFVHRGRGRMRDRRADQAGENAPAGARRTWRTPARVPRRR